MKRNTAKTQKNEIKVTPSKGLKANKVFSFFSGAGFLDLGFHDAGFETVMANELIGDFAYAFLKGRESLGIPAPKYGIVCKTIEAFLEGESSKLLARLCQAERTEGNRIGFIGGPPCPDFSVGGKNRGHQGDNGRLTESYVNLICKHKPDWFLLENVKGLWRTKKHREFFDRMIFELNKNGFVVDSKLLNAIQFGVPQDRDRIFAFGVRKDMIVSQSKKRDQLTWKVTGIYPGDEAFKYQWPSAGDPKKYNAPDELTVLHWFERNNVSKHINQTCVFKPRAGLARFKKTLEGDDSKKSFKRLHRFRYSPTACYGNNEVHLHPREHRRISVAEALAIQSLPAKFSLPNELPLSALFKMIGNGVPYLMARGVADSIRPHM